MEGIILALLLTNTVKLLRRKSETGFFVVFLDKKTQVLVSKWVCLSPVTYIYVFSI